MARAMWIGSLSFGLVNRATKDDREIITEHAGSEGPEKVADLLAALQAS
ncbi:MAG: hypothetical protein ACJ72E_09005 [Marmoricola sp.]